MTRQILVAALLAWGCGGDGKDGPGATDFPRACDDSEVDGDCVAFTGDGWEAEDVGDDCPTGDIAAACPAGAIGLCTLQLGEEFETVTSFYPGFWNDADASVACNGSGGAWTLL